MVTPIISGTFCLDPSTYRDISLKKRASSLHYIRKLISRIAIFSERAAKFREAREKFDKQRGYLLGFW